MTRPRKIEKIQKSVSGTFLKTDFSKNKKFIENYTIYLVNGIVCCLFLF